MINIIEMIDDLNEVEQDVLEEIDHDLVSYTFSTRGGDQLIYLNQVYQIKKKLPTVAGPFRIQWRCKDREHCKTTVRLLSLRENLLVQADYNIQSLGIEHSASCNVNATSIVIEQFKKDLIERASILHYMVDIHSQQLMYENLAGEYANLELHPEVTPGLLLPTYYSLCSTISRHAVTNRPPIPTIEELDDIIIGDSYRIVTIDNLQQNFVLHKRTILNEDNK